MKQSNGKALIRYMLICGVTILLVACGGGESGNVNRTVSILSTADDEATHSDTVDQLTDGSTVTSAPIPTPSVPPAQSSILSARATTALSSGDPRALTQEDAVSLLDYARSSAWDLRSRQTQSVASIYGANPVLQLNHYTGGNSGRPILITKNAIATPFINSDDGTGMAAIAQMGNGRALAYGADILAWMAGTTKEQQHLPLFSRAFKWLLTGNPDGAMPAALNFATASYSATTVKSVVNRLGGDGTAVSCAIQDPANTCWSSVDLMVFGRETANDPQLSRLVRSYIEAGKAVMYVQTGSYPSYRATEGGEAVLNAMGMNSGNDFNGNYFKTAPSVSVGGQRTLAESLAKADQFGPLLSLLEMLNRTDLSVDFSTSFAPAEIEKHYQALKSLQESGVNIFTDTDREIYRSLVLWADWYRTQINYGGTLSVTGDSDVFLRAYASDSWLWFNRSATAIPPKGAGDFMPLTANSIPVSSDFEEIEVTIAQASGITLIGRAAIPGQPVSIQVADAAGATSFGIQTNYLRATGKPLEDKVYARPRRPNSFRIPLDMAGGSNFVTPFGGPLMLAYSGATPGTVVKLRVKGAAKYAHFDFTRNITQADIDEASAAVVKGDFGWQTAKFVGGEVQQITKFAKSALSQMTAQEYVLVRLKDMLFNSNHFANGYDNMPLSSAAQDICTQLGWTCTGSIHKAPNVQHFVGWLAACGCLCSGNPSDGSAGIGSGWGHSHELGHNTVQRVMTIAPHGVGCTTECNNNILASATMLRQAALINIDTGHNMDHTGLYSDVIANRATGLSDEALRADMETRLWAKGTSRQDPLRAVHFQLAFQYSKLRLGQQQPSMYSTLEFFQLLTKADRLVSRAWDANDKNKYGMGRFANNTIGNEDLLYVLSSKIIGRDMRRHFLMYGIPVSQTALDSIADLGLPVATRSFYALANGKHNQLATGIWMDIENNIPAYPF